MNIKQVEITHGTHGNQGFHYCHDVLGNLLLTYRSSRAGVQRVSGRRRFRVFNRVDDLLNHYGLEKREACRLVIDETKGSKKTGGNND
jgi:hypothetical protein